MARTVAVLGAGVGGLLTADRLRRLLPGTDRIILVDRTLDASLGLSVLWVLRGWRRADEVRTAIDPARLPGIELRQAEVHAIDPARRTVRTTAGAITYDALVIALGAELDVQATPGLGAALASGTAHQFFTLGGAAGAHRALLEFGGGRVVVAIAGVPFKCPAAPFEGALLAADLLRSERAPRRVQVDAFTPDPMPMAVAGPAVGEGLIAMLKQHDIGFHPNRAVEGVDPERRQVRFADGSREGYDLLAMVPRHVPPRPVADLRLSPAGWIPVDAGTLETGLDGVWALGDATVLTLPNGKPLPKAAVFAEGQAEVVANGVARHLGADVPEERFDGYGSCYIELGGRVAAKGEGRFLEESGPAVALYDPSAEFHEEKRAQEADWLRRWGAEN